MSEPATPKTLDLSVVIVSYNTKRMTLDCLQSLAGELATFNSEVFVVDNASTDGSASAIRGAFPEVILIESDKNVGFGGGNNLAMKRATGRLILLLNTDAFLKPGGLRELTGYLDRHPEVALVGPRLLNVDGSLQRSCYRYPSPLRAWAESLWISGFFAGDHPWGDYRNWAHDREQHVDWVIGACCLLRREVFETVGGFDPRFFMYAEETDWQQRMRGQGWRIGFTPTAEVIHLGGASGVDSQSTPNPYFFRSKDQYELKHHGVTGLIISRAAIVAGCVLRLPCWLVLSVLRPQKRKWAQDKLIFTSKLLVRGLTDWSSLTIAEYQ